MLWKKTPQNTCIVFKLAGNIKEALDFIWLLSKTSKFNIANITQVGKDIELWLFGKFQTKVFFLFCFSNLACKCLKTDMWKLLNWLFDVPSRF